MGCCASQPHANATNGQKEGQADNGKADKPAKHEIIADGLDSVVFDDAMRAKQNTTQKLEDVYELGRLLGRGGYANVYLSTHRASGKRVAVKSMRVAAKGTVVHSNDSTWSDVAAEVAVLCRLEHPNVITLDEFFFTETEVHLVTPLVQGGELLEAVAKKGSYSEADARGCFAQLLAGVSYLHAHGIAHRDLKLENLLLETPGDITHIRIVDFGLAKGHVEQSYLEMDTICGTPHYVAPEVIAVKGAPGSKYGTQVDVWACGVVLFILLSGQPPFFNADMRALYRSIMRGSFAFQDPIWDSVSDQAKDLIAKLLVVDPKSRLTAEQALQHPWLQAPVTELNATPSLAGAQQQMRLLPERMSVDVQR